MDVSLDTPRKTPVTAKKPRASRACKVHLLSREVLDARTKAHRQFDAIAKGIAHDLSADDPEQLTVVEKFLVEAFCGVVMHINDLNAKLLLGQEVDILQHSQVVSMMVRIASRIGISRRFIKDISPTIDDIARDIAAQRAAGQGDVNDSELDGDAE
jgi:hypothetical protein